jgi:outer membrane protein assembly factor BamB
MVWKIKAGQPLSAGVGAEQSGRRWPRAKGDVLAFSAEDGKPKWQAKVSSEVLAAPGGWRPMASREERRQPRFPARCRDGGRKWVYQRRRRRLSHAQRGFPGVCRSLSSCRVSRAASWWRWRSRMARQSGRGRLLAQGATELDRVADIVAPCRWSMAVRSVPSPSRAVLPVSTWGRAAP